MFRSHFVKRFKSAASSPAAGAALGATHTPLHSIPLFQQCLATNPTLRRLLLPGPAAVESVLPPDASPLEALAADRINAPTTMPGPVKTRATLFADVAAEFPEKQGVALTFKQWLSFGKMFIFFYKNGIVNVYKNGKAARQILSGLYVSKIDEQGKDVKVRVPRNVTKLDKELMNTIYLKNIEHDVKSRAEGQASEVMSSEQVSVLNISRSQYQLLHRTRKDYPKLPAFALAFIIFEEFLPLVCYFVPEMSPTTCVLPMIFPRLMKSSIKATEKLATLREITYLDENLGDIATSEPLKAEDIERGVERISRNTPYTLPVEELHLLVRSLNLVTKYLPLSVFPETYLRDKLSQYHTYISIDNHLIQANGGIHQLSTVELIKACTDRTLIDFSAQRYADLVSITDKNDLQLQILRVKLAVFMTDLPQNQVGYLGTNFLRDEKLAVNYQEVIKVI